MKPKHREKKSIIDVCYYVIFLDLMMFMAFVSFSKLYFINFNL